MSIIDHTYILLSQYCDFGSNVRLDIDTSQKQNELVSTENAILQVKTTDKYDTLYNLYKT